MYQHMLDRCIPFLGHLFLALFPLLRPGKEQIKPSLKNKFKLT